MANSKKIIFICAVNKFSGGGLEVKRLIGYLKDLRFEVTISYLFSGSNRNLFNALLLFPVDLYKLIKFLRQENPDVIVTTHFSTLLVNVFFSRPNLWSFIQDVEWNFPSSNKAIQKFFQLIITFLLKRCSVLIFGNAYLQNFYENLPCFADRLATNSLCSIVFPVGNLPPSLDSHQQDKSLFENRKYDLVFIIRKGHLKNISMYLEFVKLLSTSFLVPIKIALVDPQHLFKTSKFVHMNNSSCVKVYNNLNQNQFFQLLANSKFFLLLSKHEGFGLPPLEAMAKGCIPLVLNNGGSGVYMTAFRELYLPSDTSIQVIVDRFVALYSAPAAYLQHLSCKVSHCASLYFEMAENDRRNAIKFLIQSL